MSQQDQESDRVRRSIAAVATKVSAIADARLTTSTLFVPLRLQLFQELFLVRRRKAILNVGCLLQTPPC